MREEIDRFLTYIAEERQYSPNTYAAYHNDLSQFADYLHGRATGWDQVHGDLILGYIASMQADQEYASATVARKVAAIKSFFHYLADSKQLEDDPTATLDSPRVSKRLPKALSVEDMERLLSYPVGDRSPRALRDRALLEVLYGTGLRVTEVVSLNVDDVNLASATARVMRSRSRRERIIPIHARAVDPLREYMTEGRRHLLRDPEDPALFLNHRGERLTRQGLWLIVKHYVRVAGIQEEVTPHTLRHTFAAHLLDSRAELEYVQEILGHANISTTQIYTQVATDDTADGTGPVAGEP